MAEGYKILQRNIIQKKGKAGKIKKDMVCSRYNLPS